MELYNKPVIDALIQTIYEVQPGLPKEAFIQTVQSKFNLIKDRSVYNCNDFAVRFCTSKSRSFSNTVLSLSALEKYDEKPFIVVLCTPQETFVYLANSTFLKKLSHSSQELRVDNIKGSFNGSDIVKEYGGIPNSPEHFESLFAFHQAFTWEENLERLVEATGGIVPHKKRFEICDEQEAANLESAPERTVDFLNSSFFNELEDDLNARTSRSADSIVIAALIDNVNLRGRVIEELITTDSPLVIESIKKALLTNQRLSLKTDQELGDYSRRFPGYMTETDIKTKVLFLQSAPKAFNVDKMLSFLATDNSVYLFYLVGINERNEIQTRLVSVFEHRLLNSTKIQHHWAGRNSRGVAQFEGSTLDTIIEDQHFEHQVDVQEAKSFIFDLLNR